MSSKSNKFKYSDILGTIILIAFLSRFFLNTFIGIKETIEVIFGIGLSFYIFSFSNKKSKVDKNEELELKVEKSAIEKIDAPIAFSSFKRLIATAVDFVIITLIFAFSFDYLSHYISEGVSLSICFTAIYLVLYSFIQFKNWSSLNWIFNKLIVKNNGSKLSYSDFFLRTLQKLIVIFAYTFLITFIIFPPMKYFDEGLTPVDVFSKTRETDSNEP